MVKTYTKRLVMPAAIEALILSITLVNIPSVFAQNNALRPLPAVVSVSPNVVSASGWLTVNIEGVDDLKNYTHVDPSTFRLRLDGQLFNGLLPDRRGSGQYAFDLAALHQDKNWLRILQAPPILGIKPVTVGIATSGDDLPPKSGQAVTVRLRIFSAGALMVAVLGVLVILGLVSRLGVATDMLLDSRPVPAGKKRPYSLARCQMTFWFVLIAAVFVVLTLVTGDYNNIVTDQSLVLLGISGATGLSSIAMDWEKAGQSGSDPVTAPVHTTFFEDLLTDDTGWALHRVQVFVWTLILGVVSLWSAYNRLTLPNFDTNLLVLMGISSGLYLGFKWPEAQTSAPLPGARPPPGATAKAGTGAPAEATPGTPPVAPGAPAAG